jgi:dTDP-4-amino-4,6-dideoxygalactose transaminase
VVDPRILFVSGADTVRDTMTVIDNAGLGVALWVDGNGTLLRTVTDGDLRRLLLSDATLENKLESLPAQVPLTLPIGSSRREALELMSNLGVTCIPLVDNANIVHEIWSKAQLGSPILLSTPHMGDEERNFVQSAFDTNWIAPLGPNVDAFESELASKVGIAHAAAVSSGTAAIHLALRLLNVGPGDRVFCSSLTFAASANPIIYQGAEPVFIDSEEASWNMCPHSLDRAFEIAGRENKMPKAVIVVNLYGQSADMDPIIDLCRRYGVPIVEDAAESLGATYKGKASGTFGRLGIYSFNGNKIITTSGGGMLISDDEDMITRARFLSTQARDPAPWYEHSEIGFNYRMSNILAGVGRGQLGVLDARVESRRAVFEKYRAGLSDITGIRWMPEPDWSFSTHWLTAATVDENLMTRDQLIASLADELIEARPVWKPLHLQPVFSSCSFHTVSNYPVSNRLFETGICLPSGSNMTDKQTDRIVDTIRSQFQ